MSSWVSSFLTLGTSSGLEHHCQKAAHLSAFSTSLLATPPPPPRPIPSLPDTPRAASASRAESVSGPMAHFGSFLRISGAPGDRKWVLRTTLATSGLEVPVCMPSQTIQQPELAGGFSLVPWDSGNVDQSIGGPLTSCIAFKSRLRKSPINPLFRLRS